LSKGWMAIVRTCDGRPPPAKPYFVTQPEPNTRKRRRLETPDRRIEGSDGIGSLDDEEERAPRAFVTILDSLIRPSLHPLSESAAVDALEARERIATERDAPVHGRTNVRAQSGAVNADHGVALGWKHELTQCGPQKRARRDEAARHVGTGNDERVPDQHRGSTPVTATEKEIETDAVRVRDARHAVASRRHVLILQLPLKHDAAMPARPWRRGQPSCRGGGPRERSDARRRAGRGRTKVHEHEDAASES